VSAVVPGRDEIILTTPDGATLCNSLACARAGQAAQVIATYGTLNDPGAGYHDRSALWRDCWGQSCPLCGTCWEQNRQVAAKYRPGLVVIDNRPAAAPPTGGPGVTAAYRPAPGGTDSDAQRWREAAQLRTEHRAWIVIWLASGSCFKAYRRLPGARRDTALSAATRSQMAALIAQAEQPTAAQPGPGTR
jgi:hypothetical protein